jgi:hypothetical protein
MAKAGSSIGSIYARIGADTSDFQAKLAQAGTHLNTFVAGAARTGKAASSGLAVAGQAAGEVGRSLRSMAVTVDMVAGTNIAAYAFMGSSALRMGKEVALGASSLSTVAAMTGTVGAAAAASAVGVSALALAVGAVAGAAVYFATKGTGLQQMLTDESGTLFVYAESLAKNEQAFRSAAMQVDHMKTSLKLSGPEWQYSTTRTKESALQLAILLEKITQHARVVVSTKPVRDGYTQSFLDLGDRIRANQQALATYTEQTNKFYGVVTKSDVRDQLKKTMIDLQVMQKEGINAQQIIENAGPKILAVIEQAKKMGIDVPPVLLSMAEAIQSKNDLWVGDLMTGLGKIPEAMRESSAANATELARVEAQFKSGIKGGFVEGTKEGIDSMQEQLAAAAANLKLTIPIDFAHPDLETLIQSMIDGNRAKTTGSAP